MDAECDGFMIHLFSDYQKLYNQKELTYIDKTCSSMYQKLLDKVKTAAQQATDTETKV